MLRLNVELDFGPAKKHPGPGQLKHPGLETIIGQNIGLRSLR